jgi:hypothetical protein
VRPIAAIYQSEQKIDVETLLAAGRPIDLMPAVKAEISEFKCKYLIVETEPGGEIYKVPATRAGWLAAPPSTSWYDRGRVLARGG